jgi:hypothetical protein
VTYSPDRVDRPARRPGALVRRLRSRSMFRQRSQRYSCCLLIAFGPARLRARIVRITCRPCDRRTAWSAFSSLHLARTARNNSKEGARSTRVLFLREEIQATWLEAGLRAS